MLLVWACRTSPWKSALAAEWPGWTKRDAGRSPVRLSPLPSCSRPVCRARLAALLDDSKRLSAEQRLAAFQALHASGRAEIGVGAASVGEIERLNILHAALLAMCRAVARLPSPPDLVLVDGNQPPPLGCPLRCVIGGDGLSLSIAAASIVAKVLRDRAMTRLAVRFPDYGWETNAGYATEFHVLALRRMGPTPHHRPSFGTVSQLRLQLL